MVDHRPLPWRVGLSTCNAVHDADSFTAAYEGQSGSRDRGDQEVLSFSIRASEQHLNEIF